MKYTELKQKQEKDIDGFPMKFAFSEKQFKEVLDYFNTTEKEAPDKLLSIPGGGFIKKTDRQAFKDMFTRHNNELTEAMKDDLFLIDAITYELANHEYCITGDPTDTIAILDLDMEDRRTISCFNIARSDYMSNCNL